ncbi:MAG: DsrE family protein [Mariniphaga sp.]|nr:DsrE family protein [Mariniphaga sp.]
MAKNPDLLITLTTGKQDRGTRATLALSWGCAALAMSQEVSIFFTMDGTLWASKGSTKGVKVAGFEPLKDYFEQFIELGGEILVCAPCSEYYCSVESITGRGTLIEEAELTGLATIVSSMGDNTKTITF